MREIFFAFSANFPARQSSFHWVNNDPNSSSDNALTHKKGELMHAPPHPCSIRLASSLLTATLLAIQGCGANYENSAVTTEMSSIESDSDSMQSSVQATPQINVDETSETGKSSPPIKRRIIYKTEVGLVVKDYDAFEAKFPGIVESLGGFISKSETNRRYSNEQSGIWVARIPVDRYTEFIQGVDGLGFAESRREDAQDVTDEFVDTEARIRNNRKLEERIIQMLEDRTGKLSDVLEIERELARVREEIERMEGHLRVLADRSAMATITIRCREEEHYTPPAAPTLVSRLSNSWSGSMASLQFVGESLLVASVALIPWAVVFGTPTLLLGLLIRRRIWRKS